MIKKNYLDYLKIKTSRKNNEIYRQKKNFLKVYPYLNSSTKRIETIIQNEIKKKLYVEN